MNHARSLSFYCFPFIPIPTPTPHPQPHWHSCYWAWICVFEKCTAFLMVSDFKAPSYFLLFSLNILFRYLSMVAVGIVIPVHCFWLLHSILYWTSTHFTFIPQMMDTKAASSSPITQTMQQWSSLSVVLYRPVCKFLWNISLGVRLFKSWGVHGATGSDYAQRHPARRPVGAEKKAPLSSPCPAPYWGKMSLSHKSSVP